MIKSVCSSATGWLVMLFCSLVLLSACTSPPGTPSAALKRQFTQMQQQQRQQAEQIEALQQQLALLQQNGSALRPESAQLLETPVVTTTQEPSTIPAAIGQEVSALADSAASYLAAFSNLAAGRYAAAESGFSNFINSYPDHQYTPNARYWLASTQVSQDKLQDASTNLRQVIVDTKGQDRAPAALALLAKIYLKQHLNDYAEEVLEQLRSRYPDSNEAQHYYRSDDQQP